MKWFQFPLPKLTLLSLGAIPHMTAEAQTAPVAPPNQPTAVAGSSQAPEVRTPRPAEVSLLQALRSHPATASYPFSTEPRGTRILLRGRVGAKIVHDVAIRMAIDLGVPVEDGILIDTAFNPGGGRGGFGTVPGPGPMSSGGVGFGGPPAFGNAGIGPGAGAYGGGYGLGPGGGYGGYGLGPGGGYGGGSYAMGMGGSGGGIPPVLGFPSAGSYGGAPSLTAPPIFGRYDDPFYGFDPPAVLYPPWWGALNTQRVQSNGSFDGGPPNAPMAPGGVTPSNANAMAPGQATSKSAAGMVSATNAQGGASIPANPSGATETDIGPIPDGTIDMAINAAGVATLRGGVPTMAERVSIGQEVAKSPGVTQVVNLLTIKSSLSRMNIVEATPPPPVPVEPAATPTNRPATAITSTPLTPALATRTNPPAVDATSDSSLTDRASKGLVDRAATIGSTVRVKVRDGVAQVSGKVASVYEAMLAHRSVEQTPGIKSVDDRLEFPVPDGANGSNPLVDKGRPDDVEPYLKAQLRRQVGDFAHIDRVRVQADALDIRGTLARSEDRDRFDAVLRSMPILRGFQVQSDMPVVAP